jgi:hypothetical protein
MRVTTMGIGRILILAATAVLGTGALAAQQAQEPQQTPPAQQAPETPEPAPPPKPPEGPVIINLPSSDVPREGTLTLLFTHRFSQALQDSDIHSLFSFDSGADIGIGLWYAPIHGLDVGFYRSSNLDVYELSAKYQLPFQGAFHAAVRAGADFRTEKNLDQPLPGQTSSDYSRNGFFAQGVVSYMIADRARFTLVPTYVSETSGQPFSTPKQSYKDLFSVPAAVSIRVLRSVNVQGEVYPRLGRADSQGVGWICAIEKTVPNHRFAFTVGNVRTTTVDQYISSVPFSVNPRDFYIGFNLVRQWKLK